MERDVCWAEIVKEAKKKKGGGEKKKTQVKGTAQASERTLKRVTCCACHNPRSKMCVWIEKKWQSWRSVVSDGAKTFFFL